MLGPLTYLDVGLIAICLISGLLAMYRGLTREVLSIMSWALALAATLYVVLYQKALAEQLADQVFQSVPLAQIVIGATVFVLVLIFVHLVTVRFSDRVLDSRVGVIDRLFGFAFGVLRGFLLVVIAYLFFEFLAEEKTHPSWVRQAQSLSLIRDTGHSIRGFFSDYLPEDLIQRRSSGGEQG